jgi:hypothetical protein
MAKWRYNTTILDIGTRWRWVVSFTPWPLYHQEKSNQYPLDRRLGGPQSRSRWCTVEKNVVALPRSESRPSSPSLYQLKYRASPRYNNNSVTKDSLCIKRRCLVSVIWIWEMFLCVHVALDVRMNACLFITRLCVLFRTFLPAVTCGSSACRRTECIKWRSDEEVVSLFSVQVSHFPYIPWLRSNFALTGCAESCLQFRSCFSIMSPVLFIQ